LKIWFWKTGFTMSIKTGDLVKVITGGKDRKGKIGRVLEVCPKQGRVKVEGVALIKKHLKAQKSPKHPEGGIIEDIGTVHISNVMLMSESLGRPVRLGSAFTDKGEKIRVARGKNLKAEAV
jgi:large subunit ribosomal protein L24